MFTRCLIVVLFFCCLKFSFAKTDFLDIAQYKIHPNWSMGCNNLGNCISSWLP